MIKGTVSEDFLLQVFFSWITFPKLLKITLGSFRIFSKIRGDIHKSRCTTGVYDTGGKLPPVSTTLAANLPPVSTTPAANFATSSPCVVDSGGKLRPVSMTPAANLPLVSLTLVANNGNNIRLQTPESELEGKNLYTAYVSSTTQRWPNKIINIFLIEDFFHLPPVSTTPVANLELRISPRIFEKIRNGLNGIIWGSGETESEAKNLVTLSL